MSFNALISNIDDHPRNHALIAKDTDWKLSPAYDLTPAGPSASSVAIWQWSAAMRGGSRTRQTSFRRTSGFWLSAGGQSQ